MIPPVNPADNDDLQKEAAISFTHACEAGDIAEARRSLPLAGDKIKLSQVFNIVAKRNDLPFLRAMIGEFRLDKNEALRQSVVQNNMPMVEYLLQQGVDPLFDKGRDIKIAAFNGYTGIFRKLLDSAACDEELLFILALRAVENFQKEILDELLDHRIDLHWQDDRLLREMAGNSRPQTDALSYLLARGADIHVLDEAPLAQAIYKSRFRNIPVLLQAGADPMLMTDGAREEAEGLALGMLIEIRQAEKERQKEAEEIVSGMQMPEDLAKEYGPRKTSGMMLLVRAEGVKSLVHKISTEHPAWASGIHADMLTGKQGGLSPLELALRMEQHKYFFMPVLWRGREEEMKKLWDHLPPPIRRAMPWEETVHDLRSYHAAQEKQQKLLNRVNGLPRLRR